MDWMMMTLLEMEIQHKPNGTDRHKKLKNLRKLRRTSYQGKEDTIHTSMDPYEDNMAKVTLGGMS